jgi:hypothetical protein
MAYRDGPVKGLSPWLDVIVPGDVAREVHGIVQDADHFET